MIRIDSAERRRRLGARHHLAPGRVATDLVELAGNMVGLHASDPSSVYLQAFARTRDLAHEDLQGELYERRRLLKVLGMRRTMFVVPVDLAGIIHAACARALGITERKRTIQMIDAAGIADEPKRWLEDVEAETIEALTRAGEATAADLTKVVPGLRVQIPFGAGKKWQGKVGVSTRMLFLLAAEGRIIRAKPKGSWLSSLYRWAPMDRWVPGGLPNPTTADAQAELARRWLRTFGPGTQRDLQWWAGWTVANTKRALEAVGAVEVELDEGTGFVLPDDTEPTAQRKPWIALLPGLDATTMGWNNRSWYLGDHGPAIFDRNGNAGPTIWRDGRIVGGWAQAPDGRVVYRLLEDVGSDVTRAVRTRAEAIGDWLGGTRVIPRFRTPLESELSA